jgi:hypothetical protein
MNPDHSPSGEANSRSASQQVSRFLWNTIVRCLVQVNPPLAVILRHMNPLHAFISYLSKEIIIWTSRLHIALPNGGLLIQIPNIFK